MGRAVREKDGLKGDEGTGYKKSIALITNTTTPIHTLHTYHTGRKGTRKSFRIMARKRETPEGYLLQHPFISQRNNLCNEMGYLSC